jgi:hypothetical protein
MKGRGTYVKKARFPFPALWGILASLVLANCSVAQYSGDPNGGYEYTDNGKQHPCLLAPLLRICRTDVPNNLLVGVSTELGAGCNPLGTSSCAAPPRLPGEAPLTEASFRDLIAPAGPERVLTSAEVDQHACSSTAREVAERIREISGTVESFQVFTGDSHGDLRIYYRDPSKKRLVFVLDGRGELGAPFEVACYNYGSVEARLSATTTTVTND